MSVSIEEGKMVEKGMVKVGIQKKLFLMNLENPLMILKESIVILLFFLLNTLELSLIWTHIKNVTNSQSWLLKNPNSHSSHLWFSSQRRNSKAHKISSRKNYRKKAKKEIFPSMKNKKIFVMTNHMISHLPLIGPKLRLIK